MADLRSLKAEIKKTALQYCSACGIAGASPFDSLPQVYRAYLGSPQAAYLGENASVRADISRWFPPVKSVLVCAFSYWRPADPVPGLTEKDAENLPSRYRRRMGAADDNGLRRPARFALCGDYHREVKKRLGIILEGLLKAVPEAEGRCFVDSAPVAEKPFGQRAGIGFQGRNTLLINKEMGSYFVIGGIALSLALEPDQPFGEGLCGSCRKCIDACPTGALSGSGLSMSRCLAYWLNAAQEPMPDNLSPSVRGMAAGCDLCQEVCPWNSGQKESRPDLERRICGG